MPFKKGDGKWNRRLSDRLTSAEMQQLRERWPGELENMKTQDVKFIRDQEFTYYSLRYDKYVTVPKGYPSDGASGSFDLDTSAWWVHDRLCNRGTWDDGTPVTNWQASTVLSDILKVDGHWFFARRWFIATWLFGGGKARKNGMV